MTNPDNVGGLPELLTKWRAWLHLIGPDVARRVLEACINDVGELCRAAPAGGELTENERRRAATFKIPQVGWACVSRQQSLPEPADCDWPMCGCDPYADTVIEALQESGVIRDHSAPAGGDAVRDALAGQTIYLMGREHISDERKPMAELVYGMTVPGTGVLFCMKDTEAAIPKDVDQVRKFRGVGELERTGYIPAGSADERECKRCDGTGQRYNNAAEDVTECGACRHSAPAGSGEVEEDIEALSQSLELMAQHRDEAGWNCDAECLRTAAALLRKLQQGAE